MDEVSITGEDAFIALTSLWPKVDFRSTRFWGSQGHAEDACSEGGGRGGNVLVSEPGSLTVTRPAGVVVGAEGKLGAVSIEARPPELGVWLPRRGGRSVGADEFVVVWKDAGRYNWRPNAGLEFSQRRP